MWPREARPADAEAAWHPGRSTPGTSLASPGRALDAAGLPRAVPGRALTSSGRSLVALGLALALASPAGAGVGSGVACSVRHRGSEIAGAECRERSGAYLVSAAPVAASLGLEALPQADGLAITDVAGTRFVVRPGDVTLQSSGRRITLEVPAEREGGDLLLPLSALAELAGVELRTDRDAHTATLVDRGGRDEPARGRDEPREARDASVAAGWEGFRLEKSLEERAESERVDGALTPGLLRTRPADVLPPDHGLVHLGVGLGYVVGLDAASEWNAQGAFGEADADGFLRLTLGSQGVKVSNGRATVTSASRRLRGEAGDVVSDLYSLVPGVRGSVRTGKHEPGLALYAVKGADAQSRSAIVAVRDSVRLGQALAVGGELASDGSAFAHADATARRLSVGAYARRGSAHVASGAGVYASGELPFGIRPSVGFTREGAGPAEGVAPTAGVNGIGVGGIGVPGIGGTGVVGGEGAFGSLSPTGGPSASDPRGATTNAAATSTGTIVTGSVRIPLPGFDVTLSAMRSDTLGTHTLTEGLALSRAFRGLMLQGRYERRSRTTLDSGALSVAGLKRDDLILSASYRAFRRLGFDAQLGLGREDGGSELDRTGQVTTSAFLGGATRLEVTTFAASGFDPLRGVIRLRQGLGKRTELFAEYGHVGAFQGSSAAGRGLKLTLRTDLDVKTPGRGAEVAGTVLDSLGEPLEGALVRLGPWAVSTDSTGAYAFRHVPTGSLPISLDAVSLPPPLVPGAEAATIDVGRKGTVARDLTAVRLGGIEGVVFVDANQNGKPDAGEGVPAVVVKLEGEATVSGRDGRFGFYDRAPGHHVLVVDGDRIPSSLLLAGDDRFGVDVKTGRTSDPVGIRLVVREKPIEFQALR